MEEVLRAFFLPIHVVSCILSIYKCCLIVHFSVFYKYSFVAPHELTQQEGGASAVLTGNQVTDWHNMTSHVVATP